MYGMKEETGGEPRYVDTCMPANARSVANCRPFPTRAPNFHCHANTDFPGGVCHFHVVNQDPYITGWYGGAPGAFGGGGAGAGGMPPLGGMPPPGGMPPQ